MRTLSLFIFLIMGMTNSYSQVFTFSDLQTKEAPGTVWKVTVDPNKKLVEFYMNDTKMRSFRIYDSKKYLGGFSFSIKQGEPAKDFDAFEKGTCNSVWISSTFLPFILLPLDVDKRWVGLEMKENSRVGRWDIEALRNYMEGNSASSASTKTNATTKPSSVAPRKPAAANPAPNSLIARPALPKKMTEKQMMMHPFGLLKEDLTGFTKQQVAKDMKTLFGDNVEVSESGSDINIVAGNYDGKGYDMSYKGYTPKAGLFYFEGKLQGYNYTFLFEKGSHTLKSVVSLAEGFVNGLMRDGVNMYDDEAYYGDNYEFSAHSKGRKITVMANDLGESQDYIMMTILITVN